MRSPHRMHERSTFYKYMSLNTAKIVLDTCSLRWSSPVIFNDPFDVPREVMAGIDEVSLGKALAKKLIEELKNPRNNVENLNPRIKAMLAMFKKLFPHGIPTEVIENFHEMVEKPPVGAEAPQAIQEMKDVWKGMLSERRILCLSESPTIPPMWNHYADKYKGIVIELECVDSLDSAWLLAKPIKYTNEMPLTYTNEGMADLLFLSEDKSIDYINTEITFIKTEDWTYEKEWRVSTYARPGISENYSDFRFHPLELKPVILGPLFEEDKIDEIISRVKPYPKAQIYKSTFGEGRVISIDIYSRKNR